MRKNSRFGNYQATQTEDKSQKEVNISLLETDHTPQQSQLGTGGMTGVMQRQGSQLEPAPRGGSSTRRWALSALTKSN